MIQLTPIVSRVISKWHQIHNYWLFKFWQMMFMCSFCTFLILLPLHNLKKSNTFFSISCMLIKICKFRWKILFFEPIFDNVIEHKNAKYSTSLFFILTFSRKFTRKGGEGNFFQAQILSFKDHVKNEFPQSYEFEVCNKNHSWPE